MRLGLRENLGQFSLLVLVNAFVGGMVGLERPVVPLIGSEQFGLLLRTAIFSFIITFGLVKAISNLFAGGLADRFGRKKILVAGLGLRCGRPLGRSHRRHFEGLMGHRVCGSIDVYLRSSRGSRHAGADEG